MKMGKKRRVRKLKEWPSKIDTQYFVKNPDEFKLFLLKNKKIRKQIFIDCLIYNINNQ
jgi:hypothetical protein